MEQPTAMDHLAERHETAGDLLAATQRTLPDLAAAGGHLGADAAGRPGRVGAALHARWEAVLAARVREAADAAERLADTAVALRDTSQEYARADTAAARRLGRVV